MSVGPEHLQRCTLCRCYFTVKLREAHPVCDDCVERGIDWLVHWLATAADAE
jgi:hypothetical protein